MPLRDHFRPPLDDVTSWEGLHGGWPMVIVQHLFRKLRYVAEPRIHWGRSVEIDVPTYEKDEPEDEYEVKVYDTKHRRRLVAAVELVSPSNKDRPESRRLFVAKCATLLQKQVSVTIVDLVTARDFNLYGELLELIGQADPSLGAEPPPIYAATCRTTKRGPDWIFESWLPPLALGQPLPTLPLWLADNLAVPLELEASYEETCRVLRIA